jgi:hypothetical protein
VLVKFAVNSSIVNTSNPGPFGGFLFFLLESFMRTFLGFSGILSAMMAPVSFFCWVAGEIDTTMMVVFVLAFFGMALIMLWELEYTPE